MSDPRTRAAHQASLLFAVATVRSVIAVLVTDQPTPQLLGLAGVELTLVALGLWGPWRRLPRGGTMLLLLPGFAVVAVHEGLGLTAVAAQGVPFMIAFAWLGANHRRWSSLRFVPLAAAAYALPTAVTGDGVDARAMLLTLCGSVIVAETIAYAMDTAVREHSRAEQAARAFGVVARASAGLQQLEPGRVLTAVSEAVLELGYDGAELVPAERARTMAGVVGAAWRSAAPVVDDGTEASTGGGGVAVPVFRRREVVGVLHATTSRPRAVHPEEVEAVRVLAATAGAALDNAEQFVAERTSVERLAAAALTDPLTGVGNRRQAHELLAELKSGDSVVMVDLDHFKDVNDGLGHAAGDVVLRELAAHLLAGLREHDRVARFGGEEFLIVLPAVDALRAERTVERLQETWRATGPASTFSAGIAEHMGGPPDQTLERADQALYAAKAAGRDTLRLQGVLGLPDPRLEVGSEAGGRLVQ